MVGGVQNEPQDLGTRSEQPTLIPEEVYMIGPDLGDIFVMFVQRKRVALYIEVHLKLVRPVVGRILVDRMGLV